MATILVAEDDVQILRVLAMWLSRNGHEVIEAHDGLEASEALAERPVDLIVSDVNMPNMDGLALTAKVRADTRVKDTPVVLVTSLDAPHDHARALEAGADAYIVKSAFSQEGLLETVSRLI